MSLANQAQHDAWNGDSGHRWAADAQRRDEVLAPIADALFTAVELRVGEAVLDLGCGCGVTTIAAADAVAPGVVVGIDLSEPMLALTRARAGDRSITFVQADAQTHRFDPGRFDVAISRFGTMFFDDPVAAFANVGTARCVPVDGSTSRPGNPSRPTTGSSFPAPRSCPTDSSPLPPPAAGRACSPNPLPTSSSAC